MSLPTWIVVFAAITVVCAWFALGNGTESFFGLMIASLLGADAEHWSEAGIQLFFGGTWILLAIWFVLGLLDPAMRFS